MSSKANAVNLGMRLIYNHRFRKPGRSFSFMASYNYSNQREKEWSYALNRFYLFNDSIDTYDQYADNHTWSHSAMGRVSWTEPLGDPAKGWSLIAAYRASYRWNDADKLTYDYPLLDPTDPLGGFDYTNMQFNDSLSNRFRNHFFNQDIRLGIRKVTKAYNLEAGLSLVPSMSESFDLINSARNIDTRWVWNFAPYLRYRYKMGKSRSLNMFYMGRSSQPSMTQLQPVADYSDPLRVVIGNPDLDPSFSHHVMLRFQDFNSAAQRSMMAMADLQLTQNSIISKTTFNQETGGQTTTYTNVNGVWNGRVMFMSTIICSTRLAGLSVSTMRFATHRSPICSVKISQSHGVLTMLNLNFARSIVCNSPTTQYRLRPIAPYIHTVGLSTAHITHRSESR